MKKILALTVLSFFLTKCAAGENKPQAAAGGPSKKEIKENIRLLDDSLKTMYQEIMQNPDKQVPSDMINRAIDLKMEFYNSFPEDAFAAECLDKVQQLHLQEKSYAKSVEAGDLLIAKYPRYKQRAQVLMSVASTYDYMLKNIPMATKYYQMLLDEYPKMNPETREMIAFRMEHIDLTFEEMVELQMRNIPSK